MKTIVDKRTPFARVDLRPLDRIDFHVDASRDRVALRNLYLTLCQVATLEMDAAHDGFEATRRVLMAKGSINSRTTLDKHLSTLQRLGLVEVDRRTAEHTGDLPNRYLLVDSPDPASPMVEMPEGDPIGCPSPTAGGRSTSSHQMGPLRGRVNAVEKEEEREREGERGGEDSDSRISGDPGAEHAIVSALAGVLAHRGQQLTASDRLAIRGVLHANEGGVDVAAAAGRLAQHYGPGGKCERRTIRSVIGLLKKEVEESTVDAAEKPRTPRSSSARRAVAAAPVSNTALKERAATTLRLHSERPATLDPSRPAMEAAWERAASTLKTAGRGAWGWMHTTSLAGTMTAVTVDSGRDGDQEQEQTIILLEAEADQLDWLALNGRRCGLIRLLEHELNADGIVVELVPTAAAAKASAA